MPFHKLVKDDRCQFDDFLAQLYREGNYAAEVAQLINLMDQIAKCRPLRGNKYHPLGPAYDHRANGKAYRVRHHEIKTNNLRLYYFHLHPTGDIVVLLGKKSTQAEDIAGFEGLVAQYLNYLSFL